MLTMQLVICSLGLSAHPIFESELVFGTHYDESLQICMVENFYDQILLLTLFIFI